MYRFLVLLIKSLVTSLVARAERLEELPLYKIPADLEKLGDERFQCARGTLAKAWSDGSAASTELVPNTACRFSSRLARNFTSCSDLRNTRQVLTIAVLYYKDATFFYKQLERWRSWPRDIREQLSFVIIDDGSPRGEKAVDSYVHDGSINFIVASILVDKKWNIGGARNLAFHIAQTEHVFVIDSDLVIPLNMIELSIQYARLEAKILTEMPGNSREIFVNFLRVFNESGLQRPHPAAMLLSKHAYWMSGGCDEDFVGHYGMTDPHFRWRSVRTANVTVRDALALSTHPLIMMEAKTKLAIPRDPTTNIRLFQEKLGGNLPWSNKFLRFPWKIEAKFCMGEQKSPTGVIRTDRHKTRVALTI